MSAFASDLVILVPDNNMAAAIRGVLSRPKALAIHRLLFDVYVHVERDPGCLNRGHDFLRPLTKTYAHALILFDRDGSGQETQTRESLEEAVTRRMAAAGWEDRGRAIVLDPELEVWVWSDSTHVDRCLGWQGRQPDLRTWLRQQGSWLQDDPKPADPKGAMETVLKRARKPRSSSIYEQIAQKVSFRRCADPAFLRFRELLRKWFPEDSID